MIRHPAFAHTEHRPYPPPRRPWVLSMVWHDLLFMHWPIDPGVMRTIVPEPFELDLYHGQAWLGVVPFRMTGVRPRCLPPFPRLTGTPNPSCFLELNVRTYVQVNGKPGVLFFSLDAESRLAVRTARRFFHLPYFDARMNCVLADEWFQYESRRTHVDAPQARLSIRYRADADSLPQPSAPGTREHFLTERYCLYTLNRQGHVLCGEIHHQPWPLQTAQVEIEELDMTRLLGLDLVDEPTCLHFAGKLGVVAWWNERQRELQPAAPVLETP